MVIVPSPTLTVPSPMVRAPFSSADKVKLPKSSLILNTVPALTLMSASSVRSPPRSICFVNALYVRPLPAWLPIEPARAPSVTKALSDGVTRSTVALVTISSTVLAPSKERFVVMSTEPATSKSPAVVTFPVAGDTVKFVPPTVRLEVVTSSPLLASTFPPKITWPVPVWVIV